VYGLTPTLLWAGRLQLKSCVGILEINKKKKDPRTGYQIYLLSGAKRLKNLQREIHANKSRSFYTDDQKIRQWFIFKTLGIPLYAHLIHFFRVSVPL
jgi:hypothetical protein